MINVGSPTTVTYTFTEDGCPFSESIEINVFETPMISNLTGGELSCGIQENR